MIYSEHGQFEKMYRGLESNRDKAHWISQMVIYSEAKKFVEDNSTSFSNLGFANFRFIFLYFFLVCSLLFVAFSMHRLIEFVKRQQLFSSEAP